MYSNTIQYDYIEVGLGIRTHPENQLWIYGFLLQE